MSTNQPDNEQIRKYLNGELDAHAMHRLERQAQDDPFLMEALEGYQASATDQGANMADLGDRLQARLVKKEGRSVILWRVLPIAASVLIVSAFGWFFLSQKQEVRKSVALKLPTSNLTISNQPVKPNAAEKGMMVDTTIVIDTTPRFANNTLAYANSPGSRHTRRYFIRHDRNTILPPIVRNTHSESHTAMTMANVVPKPANPDISETVATQYRAQATEPKITGRITDTAGRGLAGARLIAKGVRVTTNANGEFTLPADVAKDSVTVQMLGYVTKRLPIAGLDKLNIQLAEAENPLDVVEVTHKMRPADIRDAQPQDGWKSYQAYLRERAVLPDGETGKVKLKFLVDTQGHISNIRVIRGRSDTMNKKAIALVMNGPEWYGDSDSKLKEIKLKIKFHKA